MSREGETRPLSTSDWARALPWLLLVLLLYLATYAPKPGGIAAKLYWDEHGASHTYPVAWLAREQVRDFHFPLWNDRAGMGMPLLANTLDETILPWAVFKYALPFPAGANAYIAFKILLCLLGCFAAGRQFGASRKGAILLAVIYTFTGSIANNLNGVVGPIFLVPWCMFAMHRLAKKPDLISVFFTALAYGCSLLGGNPQMPFQSLLMGYGLYLFLLIGSKEKFSVGRWMVLPGAAVSAGALLALPQLIPFIQYLANSFSHHLPGYGMLHLDPRGIIGVTSVLWHPAIILMGADELGGPLKDFIATRFPPDSYMEATVPFPFEYLGAAAILFLIFALLRARKLNVTGIYFTAVAVFCLGISFGIFPFSSIGHLPPFDQMTNFRFNTYPAAFACGSLAALVLTRIDSEIFRKARLPALIILGLIAAFGMAFVGMNAGLPLTSKPIAWPVLATLVTLALIGAALCFPKKPGLLVAAAFLELWSYDVAMGFSVLPHPHKALGRADKIVDCVGNGPDYRFTGYGEVIKPNLGMMAGLHDMRSYEMIFPQSTVDWFAAANGWDRIDTLEYYLTHYYFAPEPGSLHKPAFAKASLRAVVSDINPMPGFADLGIMKDIILTAPDPSYFHTLWATVEGDTRAGWFQHAPSKALAKVPPGAGEVIAGAAAVSPLAEQSDGMDFILAGDGEDEKTLLFYRFISPANPADGRWIDFKAPLGDATRFSAAILPGPRGQRKMDFGLFSEFFGPEARQGFEEAFHKKQADGFKCYVRARALARLRIAERTEVFGSVGSCLSALREGELKENTEALVDESLADWPSGGGEIVEKNYSGDSIHAVVHMNDPGTLILADNYYPGWKAYLNGREVRIHHGGCAFRAVRVPAGKYEVEFIFKPEAFRIGLWAGAFSWLLFLALITIGKKYSE